MRLVCLAGDDNLRPELRAWALQCRPHALLALWPLPSSVSRAAAVFGSIQATSTTVSVCALPCTALGEAVPKGAPASCVVAHDGSVREEAAATSDGATLYVQLLRLPACSPGVTHRRACQAVHRGGGGGATEPAVVRCWRPRFMPSPVACEPSLTCWVCNRRKLGRRGNYQQRGIFHASQHKRPNTSHRSVRPRIIDTGS